MNTHSITAVWKITLILVGLVIFQPIAIAKHVPENFQVVDGIAIYLGVMPAEIIENRSNEFMEDKMHGGVPTKAHRDHVVVAVFDNKTGKRIENATITGRVTELGLSSQQKRFESMTIADTITYGYYFKMPSKAPYHIKLWIRIPDKSVIEAIFSHRHFER